MYSVVLKFDHLLAHIAKPSCLTYDIEKFLRQRQQVTLLCSVGHPARLVKARRGDSDENLRVVCRGR